MNLSLNKIIINIFLNIKKTFNNMIDDKFLFFYNKELYNCYMHDLINLLNHTLKEMESIYYKYFLLPKLHCKMEQQNTSNVKMCI